MLKDLEKAPIVFVSFIQSLLLSFYIFLIGLVMINGNNWFKPMDKAPIMGPLMFLTLFIISAVISSVIVLGFPFYTFWVKKNLIKALKIVILTIAFLALYFFIYIIALNLLI